MRKMRKTNNININRAEGEKKRRQESVGSVDVDPGHLENSIVQYSIV